MQVLQWAKYIIEINQLGKAARWIEGDFSSNSTNKTNKTHETTSSKDDDKPPAQKPSSKETPPKNKTTNGTKEKKKDPPRIRVVVDKEIKDRPMGKFRIQADEDIDYPDDPDNTWQQYEDNRVIDFNLPYTSKEKAIREVIATHNGTDKQKGYQALYERELGNMDKYLSGVFEDNMNKGARNMYKDYRQYLLKLRRFSRDKFLGDV